MQPQLEETNTNVADVSPLRAGPNPLFIYRKKKRGDGEKRGRSKQLSQEAITLLSEKRKVGSEDFSFPLRSSASSTANLRCCRWRSRTHTSWIIRHLAPTLHGASSFAHQPLRCRRTTTSSATWLTDREREREKEKEGVEDWAPPAATQKAQMLKSTPCSCVLQTLEVTVAFYITRKTSSSYFCWSMWWQHGESFKGVSTRNCRRGLAWSPSPWELLVEWCASVVVRRAGDCRVTWKHLGTKQLTATSD